MADETPVWVTDKTPNVAIDDEIIVLSNAVGSGTNTSIDEVVGKIGKVVRVEPPASHDTLPVKARFEGMSDAFGDTLERWVGHYIKKPAWVTERAPFVQAGDKVRVLSTQNATGDTHYVNPAWVGRECEVVDTLHGERGIHNLPINVRSETLGGTQFVGHYEVITDTEEQGEDASGHRDETTEVSEERTEDPALNGHIFFVDRTEKGKQRVGERIRAEHAYVEREGGEGLQALYRVTTDDGGEYIATHRDYVPTLTEMGYMTDPESAIGGVFESEYENQPWLVIGVTRNTEADKPDEEWECVMGRWGEMVGVDTGRSLDPNKVVRLIDIPRRKRLDIEGTSLQTPEMIGNRMQWIADYYRANAARAKSEAATQESEVKALQAQIARITERAHEEASSRGWCSEFDEILSDLGLPQREHPYTVTVQFQVQVDVEVYATNDGNAEEKAERLVDEANIGSIHDLLDFYNSSHKDWHSVEFDEVTNTSCDD